LDGEKNEWLWNEKNNKRTAENVPDPVSFPLPMLNYRRVKINVAAARFIYGRSPSQNIVGTAHLRKNNKRNAEE